MSQQERIERKAQRRPEAPTETSHAPEKSKGDQLKADIDAVLDEIDEALLENADEFVKSFVQKGGE